jgi:hypothetical protein
LENLYNEYLTIFTQQNNLDNNNITITDEDINNISTKMNITARIRRLATILKYNHDIRPIIKDSIELNKRNGKIEKEYNIKNIPLDNTTRWNSTYKMIRVTLEFRPILEYINNNTNNKEFKLLMLTNTDWKALIQLYRIFNVFVKPSIELQGQFYTTLNKSLLYAYKVHDKLNDLVRELQQDKRNNMHLAAYYDIYIAAILSGINKLDKYYPKKFEKKRIDQFIPEIISTVLDPRFKLHHFSRGEKLFFYDEITIIIRSLFITEYNRVKALLYPSSNTITI